MVASPRCEKAELKKGPWTPEEDQKLLAYIEKHGHGNWRALPVKAGLRRCGKSCRLRWTNYLRPDIKRKVQLAGRTNNHSFMLFLVTGNDAVKWSAIASHLPKRTDNEIKNYWNTHLKKRLDKMGIDPVTHKPKANLFGLGTGQARDAATLRHVAQWESARLEAEARLAREAKPKIQTCSSSASALLANKAQLVRPARPQCLDVLKAWQGVVFGMFAAGTNCLESPTSTLNFAENVLPIAKCSEILHGNPATTKIESATNHDPCNSAGRMSQELDGSNQWDCFEELNQIPQMKLKPDSNKIPMQELPPSSENAWFLNSFRAANQNAPLGDIMEGLYDTCVPDFQSQTKVFMEGENTNVRCGGNLEENKDYWNSLLSLADASGSTSHMF